MRYITPIFFQRVEPGGYNADTGDYDRDIIIESMQYADITDSSDRTVEMVYGELREGVLTVRLERPYTAPFDYIRIGERRFKADMKRSTFQKMALVVAEVQ